MAFILLVVFPITVIMSCAGVAWALGTLLNKDADARHEGSELIELSR